MKTPLISVIVPCYNVEKYVTECLESIVNQSYQNLEIIIVNDGATDNTEQKILPFLEDKRVKYIVQKNQGLSGARNTGLDNMNGEFVCFVDSDDYIHQDFVKNLYENIEKNDADVAICDYYEFVDGEKLEKIEVTNEIMGNFSRDEIMQEMLINVRICLACPKLYRSKLFANLRFSLGRIHEDEFIVHHIFWETDRVVKTSKQYYFYRQTQGSITKSAYTENKMQDFIDAMMDRIIFLRNKKVPNIDRVYHFKWMVIVKRGIRGHKLPFAKRYLLSHPLEFLIKMPQSKIKSIKFYLRVLKDYIIN